MYKLREERDAKPQVVSNMVASMRAPLKLNSLTSGSDRLPPLTLPVYQHRFGPWFVEPVICGLGEDGTPFISAMDLIGAPVYADGTSPLHPLHPPFPSSPRPHLASFSTSPSLILTQTSFLPGRALSPCLAWQRPCGDPTWSLKSSLRLSPRPSSMPLIATRARVGVPLFTSCPTFSSLPDTLTLPQHPGQDHHSQPQGASGLRGLELQ